jgi:hypothetical protein
MFWLTVRQHRTQLVVTAGLLVAFGLLLLGNAVAANRAVAGLSGEALDQALAAHVGDVRSLVGWMCVAPALIGMFWGVPVLARELERGTYVPAWTQSVSRSRWVVWKLAVLAAAATLYGLALGAMVGAWLNGFAGTPFGDGFADYGIFACSGVAVAGWWLFGFILGVTAGALFRRTLRAMGVTLVVFIVALLGMFALREHYAAPDRFVPPADPETVLDTEQGLAIDRGLPVEQTCLDAAGNETYLSGSPQFLDYVDTPPACPNGIRMVTYYQPIERYWRFQWTEAAILLAAAALLAGVLYRRVARHPLATADQS